MEINKIEEYKKGYAICWGEWFLNKNLKNELPLLMLISCLSNRNGKCYASNEFLASMLEEDECTISRKIKKLEKHNCIKVEYERRGCEIVRRYITPVKPKDSRLTEISIDDLQKNQSTIDEKRKENNISNNIISNSIIIGKTTSSEHLGKKSEQSDFFKSSFEKKIELVKKYCEEKKYTNIDAEHFVSYYESTGWVRKGDIKITNWKAVVYQWYTHNEKTQRTSGSFPISSTKSANFSSKEELGDKPEYPDYMKKPGSERCKDIPDLIKEGLYEEYERISDLIDEWNKKSDRLREQRRRY